MLASQFGVGRINRFAQVGPMAGRTVCLAEQRLYLGRRLFRRLGGHFNPGNQTAGTVISRQIGHVLIAQCLRDAPHGRMLAFAFLVSRQCGHQVFRALTRDHRDLVDLGKCRLIAFDRMATCAHGIFSLAILGIAYRVLGPHRHGRQDHKGDQYRGKKLIHFARTIE